MDSLTMQLNSGTTLPLMALRSTGNLDVIAMV